jgi:Na+/proline symporter
VRRQGVAGNWVWWAFVLTGVSTVFFYARLWRRSGVMTDLEFYEIRYSGQAASVVRGFRAVYLGLLFNCMIMATVNLAACKIAGILFGLERWETLLFVGLLNVAFAAHSGLWGVLVIDMIQFFIKMTAVIAAAYFALQAPQVGGLSAMYAKLSAMKGPHGGSYLNVLPDFTSNWDLAVAVFVMPIAVQWWAVWYPGAEPGGGSYIAQRMLASKSERDALGAVLFFNVAHYVLRPWPWIITGLASILVYPQLSDIQAAFPHLDPTLIGHDTAFPAMLKFMPVGFIGLMVGGLIAANSSTILTHLNWGASYLVHDFYQRFIKRNATEKHYVMAGRVATVLLFILSSSLVFVLDSAKDAFDVILQIGAGTGLLYLLRWFWWRINAWSEVAAMAASFAVSLLLQLGLGWRTSDPREFAWTVLVTVGASTVAWLAVTALTPPEPEATLLAFYRRVRPSAALWGEIAARATDVRPPRDGLRNLVDWLAGCALVYASLFGVGKLLFGETVLGLCLLLLAAGAGAILYRDLERRGWRSVAE